MATLTIAPPAKAHRRSDFEIIQPKTTFTGAPIEPLEKGLPKRTQSICPECLQLIDARLFEEGGAVYMEKTCAAHGEFRDKIYSDARLYLKMEDWEFGDNRGLENPAVRDAARCPDDCGLCSVTTHRGSTDFGTPRRSGARSPTSALITRLLTLPTT